MRSQKVMSRVCSCGRAATEATPASLISRHKARFRLVSWVLFVNPVRPATNIHYYCSQSQACVHLEHTETGRHFCSNLQRNMTASCSRFYSWGKAKKSGSYQSRWFLCSAAAILHHHQITLKSHRSALSVSHQVMHKCVGGRWGPCAVECGR